MFFFQFPRHLSFIIVAPGRRENISPSIILGCWIIWMNYSFVFSQRDISKGSQPWIKFWVKDCGEGSKTDLLIILLANWNLHNGWSRWEMILNLSPLNQSYFEKQNRLLQQFYSISCTVLHPTLIFLLCLSASRKFLEIFLHKLIISTRTVD